jgi:ABC-type multidrug transport system ATPase subunit
MSRPLPPTITVRSGAWQRTFAPGRDVVIGRDVRADVRLPHPGISRAHVVLRYLDGHWVAIDNKSFNGMFVGHRRVQSVDIRRQEIIRIGNPEGPRLVLEPGPLPRQADQPTTRIRPAHEPRTDVPRVAGGVRNALRTAAPAAAPPGSTTIGRASDNDIVIPDMLASGHHATLIPTPRGMQIQAAGSTTGTFVNGDRIKAAVLRQDDVVTIGNVDLVFAIRGERSDGGMDGVLVRRTKPATTTGGLDVRDVSLTIEGNRKLLDRISFSASPATLTAVIGPSGSGKSTLSNVIVGGTRPNGGTASFEGHDVHADYALLRSRIGIVPQDDVVHGQLTVDQALGYAAELRMPSDTTKQERQQVIAQVLEELEMTPHAHTRVDKLSGGQRKRVSVATELLTGPSLLVLDEPTTGLDPALDQRVMTMLRQLADAGRVIVVVTHSLTLLDLCDQVLLLAPGGKVAFCGPPGEVGSAMGATDWADIYSDICADPDGAQERFRARSGRPGVAPAAQASWSPGDVDRQAHTNASHQISTIGRRQLRLIVANRGYFIFLTLLPFIVGLLPLAVAGDAGLGKPSTGAAPLEQKQILGMMNFGAFFMGTALTVRELVGERRIFRHEQAVGLSTSAYLAAKIAVFGAIAVLQSAILVLIVTIGKGALPDANLLGSPTLELFVAVAATCVASTILGLFVSSLARTNNQVLPLTVVTLMAQIVFAGGMIPVTDRALDPVSWLIPSRWGLAATGSTADVTSSSVLIPRDSHWRHTASAWTLDIVMLAVLSVFYTGFVRWRIRHEKP